MILSLDRAEETIAAIRSALAQTGVSRHVFIVDQGSQPENLARLAADVAGRQDATLLALDCNHGVAGGRNRGSSLGHGRVIFGLDNDAEFADATTLARAVAALDDDPTLAAIGCRILLYARDADDLSSWGYPTSLLPRAGGEFDAVTFVGAGQRSAASHGMATTRHCSFAGRNSTSACVPSSAAGGSDIAVTSRCATRSVPTAVSPGPAHAGSNSCATGSISSTNGVPAGSDCCRAWHTMCSGACGTAC